LERSLKKWARPVVILDIGAQRGRSHVFEDMAGLIAARTQGEVEPALEKLGEARSRGLHAAGYFSTSSVARLS
jgi:hypothetical protein